MAFEFAKDIKIAMAIPPMTIEDQGTENPSIAQPFKAGFNKFHGTPALEQDVELKSKADSIEMEWVFGLQILG